MERDETEIEVKEELVAFQVYMPSEMRTWLTQEARRRDTDASKLVRQLIRQERERSSG